MIKSKKIFKLKCGRGEIIAVKSKFRIKFYSILLTLLFIVIIFSQTGLAQEYYADVDIVVDESGFVTISGLTNHPDLSVQNSQMYTSKKQSYWLLNITTEEVFSSFVYTVRMPDGATINYIKNPDSFKEESGNIVITGSGEDEPFSVVMVV